MVRVLNAGCSQKGNLNKLAQNKKKMTAYLEKNPDIICHLYVRQGLWLRRGGGTY